VAAALKAGTFGRRALLVDKPKSTPNAEGLDIFFGGPTGLFSKALREAGHSVDVVSLKSMGLYEPVIWSQVQHTCVKLASNNAQCQVKTLESMKVKYLQASATIDSPNKVIVSNEDGEWAITTDKVIVCTGSKPTRPPTIPFDDVRIFDSDSVNGLGFLPKEVAISGGGIISIEYAKIFRSLGAKVSLLVRSGAKSSLERIGLDTDIADQMLQFLRDDDVQILESTEVESYAVPTGPSEKLCLKLKSKQEGAPPELKVDIFLAAIGRKPNVTGFGLDKLGVKLADKGGHIEVNGMFETSVPGIFAAGDVIGPPSLASTGVHQAQGAITAMFDGTNAEQRTNFPVGMWTIPECAYYGLTKVAAEKKGLDVEEGVAPYVACLRGRVFHPEGLLKLVFQKKDGVIVGVHMIGADACELVHYGMDLVEQKVSIFTLCSTLYTAVTYHELFKEAALDGNSKVAYGAQWQTILSELGSDGMVGKDFDDETLRKEFNAMDTSGDGSLDGDELYQVFKKLGKDIKPSTVANLVRLADEDGNERIE
jgi:NAD(P) transhydrogenase